MEIHFLLGNWEHSYYLNHSARYIEVFLIFFLMIRNLFFSSSKDRDYAFVYLVLCKSSQLCAVLPILELIQTMERQHYVFRSFTFLSGFDLCNMLGCLRSSLWTFFIRLINSSNIILRRFSFLLWLLRYGEVKFMLFLLNTTNSSWIYCRFHFVVSARIPCLISSPLHGFYLQVSKFFLNW